MVNPGLSRPRMSKRSRIVALLSLIIRKHITMSTLKQFHFRSTDKIPKSLTGFARKSADKKDAPYHPRYTADGDYCGRRVHTEANEDEVPYLAKGPQRLLTGSNNAKSPTNIKMADREYWKNEALNSQKKQKIVERVPTQGSQYGMQIPACNPYQTITAVNQNKLRREPNRILLTEENDKTGSKDKHLKKDSKKLFDRLLLTSGKNTNQNILRANKSKEAREKLFMGNYETKLKHSQQKYHLGGLGFRQKQSQLKSDDKDKLIKNRLENDIHPQLSGFKEEFFGFKKDRQLFGNLENICRGATLKTEPCELAKPTIQILQKIGEGTFGEVYKAKLGNRTVAVKKVFQDRKYKNRELEILGLLKNDFVLEVIDTFHTEEKGKRGEPDKSYLNVIMEFYPQNLYEANSESEINLSPIEIKLFMYQMLRGLMYIHSIDICHRDIKPQNLLVNRKNARLVICDFGSAKKLVKGESNIAYICSRCYRAPELIFGCTNYTPMIDVWSVGCVLLELITGQPFFIGDSNIGQLVQVIKVLGTPSKTQVMNMNPAYDLDDYKFPKIKTKTWRQIFPEIDATLQSLLKQIMIYSPKERLNAAEALSHEYFDQLRDEATYEYLRENKGIFTLFNFTEEQLVGNQHLIPKLVPEWFEDRNKFESF